jgi:acyl-homoserine lactone acylase PvdQ
VALDFPYDMNPVVAPRYRYDRIVNMLKAQDKFDPDQIARIQVDTTSELARKLLPALLPLVRPDEDPRTRQAIEILSRWDGNALVDSPAPAIYNTWLMRFMVQTFADELGPELAAEYVGQRYISLERFLEMLAGRSAFFDDSATPQVESAADIATRSFQESLKLLRKRPAKRISPPGAGATSTASASITSSANPRSCARWSTAARTRSPATAKPTCARASPTPARPSPPSSPPACGWSCSSTRPRAAGWSSSPAKTNTSSARTTTT